jgi:hypothetical protein
LNAVRLCSLAEIVVKVVTGSIPVFYMGSQKCFATMDTAWNLARTTASTECIRVGLELRQKRFAQSNSVALLFRPTTNALRVMDALVALVVTSPFVKC